MGNVPVGFAPARKRPGLVFCQLFLFLGAAVLAASSPLRSAAQRLGLGRAPPLLGATRVSCLSGVPPCFLFGGRCLPLPAHSSRSHPPASPWKKISFPWVWRRGQMGSPTTPVSCDFCSLLLFGVPVASSPSSRGLLLFSEDGRQMQHFFPPFSHFSCFLVISQPLPLPGPSPPSKHPDSFCGVSPVS